MKKKIVLMLAVVCILAFVMSLSAFAAATDEFGTVETIEGMSEKSAFGDDGRADTFKSRVVLFDGTEYHTYPAYYIFKNSVNTSADFTEISAKTGVSYNKTLLIRVEVPMNVKTVDSSMRSTSSIVYIHLPETLTSIGRDNFHGCSGLKYINVPKSCTTIGPYGLNGCSSLEVLDLTEAESLKSIQQNNLGGSKITSLVFPEGFETFAGISCSTLKELVFPNSTKSIGVIQSAAFETFIVPESVTSLGNKTFDYCPKIKKVTIPRGVASIVIGTNPTFFGTTLSNLKEIVYTGSESDAIVAELKKAVPKATITFANHCDIYYGGDHEEGVILNSCQSGCGRECGIVELLENPQHDLKRDITFGEKGYFSNIAVYECCSVCKTATIDESIAPVFEFRGYSKSTFADTLSIAQGYFINHEAVSAYRKYAPSFDFGVLITVNSGTDAFVPDFNGENVIVPKFNISANYYIDIKVTGIPTSKADSLIVVCLYANDGEDTFFLENGVTTDKVTGFSYNSIN